MRLQAVLTSWGGSLGVRGQQRRTSSQARQAYRRGFRPSLAAASAGSSPEQPMVPRQASTSQQAPYDAWEQACQQVAAFQWQHGRLPRASADAQGPLLSGERPLGLWCAEQQRRKAGSKGPPLTAQERAALLAIPGWGWWASRRVVKPWVQRRQEVEAFYQQHGRLPRQTTGKAAPFLPGEKPLGKWVGAQRESYKGQRQPPLSAERIAALEGTPGWAWEDHFPWEQRRQEVEAFYQQHGRLPRRSARDLSPLLPGEEALATWVHRQQQCYKGHAEPPLPAERIAALDCTPGWSWGEYIVKPWEVRYQQVQDFVLQHGRLPREKGGKSKPLLPCERELGTWCGSQRQRWKGRGQLPPMTADQQAALAALPGWYWDVEDDRWEQQRQKLEAFVRVHGRLPRVRTTKKGPLVEGERELASWRQSQMQREQGTGGRAPLSARQQAALKGTPLWHGERGLWRAAQ